MITPVIKYIWPENNNHVIVPDTASYTSEDECKWQLQQMIYFPETIDTMSTMSLEIFTLSS
jgi:hypothetical protein